MTPTPFPPIRSDDLSLQPGGRWHRMLLAIEGRCLTLADLRRAARSGRHSRRIEDAKTWRALTTMVDLGLMRHDDWGWTLTAEGHAELARLRHLPVAQTGAAA